ncbi:hypothetical protein VPH35_002874 [Triticum aestivum]
MWTSIPVIVGSADFKKLVKMYSYVNSVLFDSSAFSLWLVLVQILHSLYPTHNFILNKSIFNLLYLFFPIVVLIYLSAMSFSCVFVQLGTHKFVLTFMRILCC